MKIATFLGARPQFIKAAVLSRLIQQSNDVEECLVHTGQHYDYGMSDIFFEELNIPHPDHQLSIGSGSHGVQTGQMLIEAERIIEEEKPDIVLVYGDTNSTLAGALAASKMNVPIAHVESGLRSFDKTMPEEVNRIMTDHVSRFLFCPTQTAVDNLKNEGITDHVYQVGDIMFDALKYYTSADKIPETIESLNILPKEYALCTLHRAGNTDDISRFRQLWTALKEVSERIPIILPLHPRTRNVISKVGLSFSDNMHIIEPVGYREMLQLERFARIILTDSGGVQREAYMHSVPCLTLRDQTEWIETVESGWNQVVGVDPEKIGNGLDHFLTNGAPVEWKPLYGDGDAGEQILEILTKEKSFNKTMISAGAV
jgi:UDP-GlcNAc3NAcA epimerase